ncbi:hypothetical protein AOLI_G00293230 [Acnodon oligacanthus]
MGAGVSFRYCKVLELSNDLRHHACVCHQDIKFCIKLPKYLSSPICHVHIVDMRLMSIHYDVLKTEQVTFSSVGIVLSLYCPE